MFKEWAAKAIRQSPLSQAEIARRMSERLGRKVGRDIVNKIATGPRDVQTDELLAISAITQVPAPLPQRTVHAVGYVGAGAQVFPIDDHELGAGLEEVDVPPLISGDVVAVIVRGDSMYPRYFDGEYLFYSADQRPPGELVGRECVVRLDDGSMLVKRLRKGSTKGRFNLESWNAPLIEDAAVVAAAEVKGRAP
jgi:phage repressor protein C with HTH and peptisase S24 domain